MPSRRKKSVAAPLKSVDISSINKATPYIQRLIQDAQLRENVKTAYDSTRSVYARLTNGKAPAKALLEDKKLQREIQIAVQALRDASDALTEAPKRQRPRKRGGFARKLFILGLGFGLALAGSETLRTKVLDLVFGKEEEFEYTPPPASATTPPSSPVGAA